MGLDIHLDDRHSVVAEDIDDLDGNLSRAFYAFVEDARKLDRTIPLCAERLPLVLEDIVAGPDLLKLPLLYSF